jgi:hypothetical protein
MKALCNTKQPKAAGGGRAAEVEEGCDQTSAAKDAGLGFQAGLRMMEQDALLLTETVSLMRAGAVREERKGRGSEHDLSESSNSVASLLN